VIPEKTRCPLNTDRTAAANVAKVAFRFVLIIGIVNFFADMTYEGARSIVGPFLSSLGASATIVGFVAGFGEMVGYCLRSVPGYFADKTRRYWILAFVGYAINMLAVPALAFLTLGLASPGLQAARSWERCTTNLFRLWLPSQ
jgi:hypothetical protein